MSKRVKTKIVGLLMRRLKGLNEKVQVGDDQEKAQSEIPTPKTEVGKTKYN